MSKITKTLGPIHFEDLDPHRFEDLVRELIYDFKQWQDIQATGRSGTDDGFDVRAREKVEQVEDNIEDDEEQKEEPSHLMDGNLWMIQCKREKEIGPKRVAEIIKGIDEKNSPYGYILVAPADFSKKSYDTFQEELRKKSVMEFHLWGKAALEDMLHMPKNDHILFTFFGISLIMKRRSRKAEIRFVMNNKNKLIKILGGGNHNQDMFESVLMRNVDDRNYPFKSKYKDFEKNPRWREQIAISLHPLGLIVKIRNFFAYIDKDNKQFDFVDTIDLVDRQSERDTRQKKLEKKDLIRDYWEHLPRKNQANFEVNKIILYEDMVVIDDKGDVSHDFPHIYCEYKYGETPFKGSWHYLTVGAEDIDVDSLGYKRIEHFPKKFTEIKKGKIYTNRFLEPNANTALMIKNGHAKVIYCVDGKYDFLMPRDKIQVKGTESSASYSSSVEPMTGIEITYKYETIVKEYLEETASYLRNDIEQQVGRKVEDKEKLSVFEIKWVGYWDFQQSERTNK